jgi:Uma2 family endonuclease
MATVAQKLITAEEFFQMPQPPDGSQQEIAPDVMVEVVSPTAFYSRVQRKVREYFRRGVRMVWVVDSEDRSVMVYRSQQQAAISGEYVRLSGEDVPGEEATWRA